MMPHNIKYGVTLTGSREFLQVMKFGGTSVGDATSIGKVAEIIRGRSNESSIIVVVSAMAGVTDKLIEMGARSASGDRKQALLILAELRDKHATTVESLLPSKADRERIQCRMNELFAECERYCEAAAETGELTPQVSDFIASLGERLSAPMVAATLMKGGLTSEAVDATELIVTNGRHGGADPMMEPTRARCISRLKGALRRGVIPVVGGFMGATLNGVLTTLGRGGSDYSATILAAALDADEVTIWTDVDGILTADPRLVPGARTIPEISYREAAELAYFGAKVLHPKTLRPVVETGIPVWIRNTFLPEKPGTKITPQGPQNTVGVKAIAAVNDAALITLSGTDLEIAPDVMRRARSVAEAIHIDVLMISHSPAGAHVYLVVTAVSATEIVEALRREFASDARRKDEHNVSVDSTIAILSLVGHNLAKVKNVVGRAVDELGRENVQILAASAGSSECNVSFVVPRKDIKTALTTTHREFQRCMLNLPSDSSLQVPAL